MAWTKWSSPPSMAMKPKPLSTPSTRFAGRELCQFSGLLFASEISDEAHCLEVGEVGSCGKTRVGDELNERICLLSRTTESLLQHFFGCRKRLEFLATALGF